MAPRHTPPNVAADAAQGMHRMDNKNRLRLLSTPLFVVSVFILALNDFVLKETFHNWLTGKLSDVVGLIAVTLFLISLWPAQRWTISTIVSICFIFWKSIYSNSFILFLNSFLPFNIGRTVDYTDCFVLPTVWLVCIYAPKLRSWSVRRWLVLSYTCVSLFLFAGTSRNAFISIKKSAVIPTSSVQISIAGIESDLQLLFDTTANKYGLHCIVCDPLSIGRLYAESEHLIRDFSMTANYNTQTGMVFFDVSAKVWYGDENEEKVRLLQKELKNELKNKFPELKIVTAKPPKGKIIQLGVYKRKSNISDRDLETREDYNNALSLIAELLPKYGMQQYMLPLNQPYRTLYYTGKIFGPHPSDRELVVDVGIADRPIVIIDIECYSSEYLELQRTISYDLELHLQSLFGKQRIKMREMRASP